MKWTMASASVLLAISLGSIAYADTCRKLMKQTVTKTIPSTKWVCEKLCGECASKPVPSAGAAMATDPPNAR